MKTDPIAPLLFGAACSALGLWWLLGDVDAPPAVVWGTLWVAGVLTTIGVVGFGVAIGSHAARR